MKKLPWNHHNLPSTHAPNPEPWAWGACNIQDLNPETCHATQAGPQGFDLVLPQHVPEPLFDLEIRSIAELNEIMVGRGILQGGLEDEESIGAALVMC